VIQSFADDSTEAVFHGVNSRATRALPKDLWRVIHRKLDLVNAAHTIDDLRRSPGNRLEALKGEQGGRLGIRVNDQYRITFRFEAGNAFEVRCEDYH
jgi:proteic killer suppression protein